MITGLKDTTTLHNGVEMPTFGLGVYLVEDGMEVIESVKAAINAGYKAIDTAAIYKNEEGVGQGIRESGVAREDLFVTTKVWNDDLGYESTLAAFEESLKKLQMDYVDLYLIHWPVAGKYKGAWKAIEKIYRDGKARAIGVCNFHQHHLDLLLEDAEVVPMVNQIELHPLLSQVDLRQYCKERDIKVQAWSPLARGKLLDHPVLQEMAIKYNKTVAQIILRWDLQSGIITIPKSTKAHRIQENATIFDFALNDDDMTIIDGINKNERVGSNPEKYD